MEEEKRKEKLVVEVELAGPSGNIFAVMGNASAKLRKANRDEEALEIIEEFVELRRY